MSFSFRPARREGVPLLIGLAGSSGSGKTYSALSLATGIASVVGGKIAFIDTENRRGLHYADRFEFMHAEIAPPFSPQRYGEAIKAADDADVAVVVIDSFSHEYEGEGGILDWANQEEAGGKKPPSQWIKPKSAHKALVNQMLRARPHIIVCLRAEEKMQLLKKPKLERDGSQAMWQGKPQFITEVIAAADRPLNERWHPICEKRFPYEITTSLLLLPGNPGVPVPLKLQEQHKGAFPDGRPITAESGRFLAAWAKGDVMNAGTSESAQSAKQTAEQWTDQYVSDVTDCATIDDLMALQASSAKALAKLQTDKPDLHEKVTAALATRTADLKPAPSSFDDDDFSTPATEEPAAEATSDSQIATDGPHPAAAIADALIASFKSAELLPDLVKRRKDAELDIAAMPDEIAAAVESAYSAQLTRLKAPAVVA